MLTIGSRGSPLALWQARWVQDRLAESLQEIYAALGAEQRLVLEYKFFEPAFYHTDVPDWGTSYAQTLALGEKAFVCLDCGFLGQRLRPIDLQNLKAEIHNRRVHQTEK